MTAVKSDVADLIRETKAALIMRSRAMCIHIRADCIGERELFEKERGHCLYKLPLGACGVLCAQCIILNTPRIAPGPQLRRLKRPPQHLLPYKQSTKCVHYFGLQRSHPCGTAVLNFVCSDVASVRPDQARISGTNLRQWPGRKLPLSCIPSFCFNRHRFERRKA